MKSIGFEFVVGAAAAIAQSSPGNPAHGHWVSGDAARECLTLGDSLFDPDVREFGRCTTLGLHRIGRAGSRDWRYTTYRRRWLVAPTDTALEMEMVLLTGGASRLLPVWHYPYEGEVLASVTPDVVTAGSVALISIRECVNGTGGCSQSFATFANGGAKPVRLSFLDSLNHRFPGGIRHGLELDLRTMRGSLGLRSRSDPNCCPSTIGAFSISIPKSVSRARDAYAPAPALNR